MASDLIRPKPRAPGFSKIFQLERTTSDPKSSQDSKDRVMNISDSELRVAMRIFEEQQQKKKVVPPEKTPKEVVVNNADRYWHPDQGTAPNSPTKTSGEPGLMEENKASSAAQLASAEEHAEMQGSEWAKGCWLCSCVHALHLCIKKFLVKFGLQGKRVAPIQSKVRERHLEMEPLCCLSSCLVRGGCSAVVCFELSFVLLTTIAVAIRLYDGGHFRFWSPIKVNLKMIVNHQFFLYVLLAYNVVVIVMVCFLSRGLVNFDKSFVLLHWYFDFFALGFNLCALFAFLLSVSVGGVQSWSFSTGLLLACFAMELPVQLWAISVVKSCYDFFVLLHVFVSLAER